MTISLSIKKDLRIASNIRPIYLQYFPDEGAVNQVDKIDILCSVVIV